LLEREFLWEKAALLKTIVIQYPEVARRRAKSVIQTSIVGELQKAELLLKTKTFKNTKHSYLKKNQLF